MNPTRAPFETGARRPHVAALVVMADDGGVIVRPASSCGGCRGGCAQRSPGGGSCTLRVALAAGRAVPPVGSIVALVALPAELSGRMRELYGVPLVGLFAGAIGTTLLGGTELAVALGAAGGLAVAMTYLRLRPPLPPAFELIDDERT